MLLVDSTPWEQNIQTASSRTLLLNKFSLVGKIFLQALHMNIFTKLGT
jgi:hypothetical protein